MLGDAGPIAFVAAVLVAIPCAVAGVYVVLRRMAFLGDALSHTVLPGVVVASMLGFSLNLGALATAVLTALGIGALARRRALHEDTAIGILFTSMFALGVVLSSTRYDPEDLHRLLFGDLLAVGAAELPWIAFAAFAVVASLALLHKELELASFDPTYAEVIGIHTDRLRTFLLVLIAVTVVGALRAAGVLLTAALLVTPAAAASLLTRNVPRMMVIAAAIGVASSLLGLGIAYATGVPSGAPIVLVATGCFGVAWIWKALRSAF
jgi:ABC-type Mn2+/Zn2+ transport system permease subunit